jgi:phosphoribosylanthranilate isomerase
MSLWVKICANTSLEDAMLAVDAGADAVGFVFASSPRRVTVEQAAAIVPRLPDSIEKIGVFVDASTDEIAAAVRACGLTGVQLHSDAGADVPAMLRAEFGRGLRILRVVHFGPDAVEQVAAYAAGANVDAVLVDSRTANAVGGTGTAFDWDAAQRTVFSGESAVKLVAAGGLNAKKAAEAIGALRPWGVDVASGVEAAPGKKDAAKVREFVNNARGANMI